MKKQIDLIILTAKKVKIESGVYKGLFQTELYSGKSLKAVVPASQTQPRKNQKTITLNSWKFGLKWD